jgi:hypothetical protein
MPSTRGSRPSVPCCACSTVSRAHYEQTVEATRELIADEHRPRPFEISLTASPANPDTRILETKSLNLHPDLIGTAWDPETADGSPAATGKRLAPIGRKHAPIRIASFEV